MQKTIFMIHGMWAGGWYWDKFQGFFENLGYHCIAPYLRRHNIQPEAPPPPELGRISLLDYAEDLESQIKELGEKPIIMGHSMGGLLAQILASRKLAKAAVLITPAAPAGILSITGSVLKTFSEVLIRWGFWKRPHRISYDKAVYSMLQKLPTEERRYVHDRCVWESGRAATEIGFWFFGVKGAQVDSSKLTCPLLIISGSEDNITPSKVVKKLAKRYGPTYSYIELGGHSHFVIREPGWEKVASYIHTWLSENVC